MLPRLSPNALKKPQSVGDIFEARDSETATKLALLIRSFGHGTTETWVATQWDHFLGLATGLKDS